jgi:hypothetical protein
VDLEVDASFLGVRGGVSFLGVGGALVVRVMGFDLHSGLLLFSFIVFWLFLPLFVHSAHQRVMVFRIPVDDASEMRSMGLCIPGATRRAAGWMGVTTCLARFLFTISNNL